MAKYCGMIGFSLESEDMAGIGIWTPVIEERKYHGDIMNSSYKWNNDTKVNEDINVSNKFSIVADRFAIDNIGCMRYVEWNGVKWKIITAEFYYPRINLYVGGVYNAQTEN